MSFTNLGKSLMQTSRQALLHDAKKPRTENAGIIKMVTSAWF
jgi:hypothetical protein